MIFISIMAFQKLITGTAKRQEHIQDLMPAAEPGQDSKIIVENISSKTTAGVRKVVDDVKNNLSTIKSYTAGMLGASI